MCPRLEARRPPPVSQHFRLDSFVMCVCIIATVENPSKQRQWPSCDFKEEKKCFSHQQSLCCLTHSNHQRGLIYHAFANDCSLLIMSELNSKGRCGVRVWSDSSECYLAVRILERYRANMTHAKTAEVQFKCKDVSPYQVSHTLIRAESAGEWGHHALGQALINGNFLGALQNPGNRSENIPFGGGGGGVLLCVRTQSCLPLPYFLSGMQKGWPLNSLFDGQLFSASFIWNSKDSMEVFLCNLIIVKLSQLLWLNGRTEERELHFNLFG